MTRFIPLIILVLGTLPANAQSTLDCGEPPVDKPVIPAGVEATRDELSTAVRTVRAYSDTVDTFISCMDLAGQELLPYLSKEQQERWDEDLNKLHEDRVDLQKTMNEEIRAFNGRVNDTDGNS